MNRRRPPHLHLVSNNGVETPPAEPASPFPFLDNLRIEAMPLADAARCMADDAVRVVVDAAADFGFPVDDTAPLHRAILEAVYRFSAGWVAERLAEYRE